MIYHPNELSQMETRFRANLINSLGGFKSIALIGTKSIQGNENLALFSSLFHIGANPALCGMVIRPNEVSENTLGNILNTKIYTVNHILPSFYAAAHQCSAKYPAGTSEFEMVDLHPEYLDSIEAPFVQESAIKFACEMVQKVDIDLNQTTLIIGKIIRVIVPDIYIGNDGFIDLESAKSITCSGLDSYHTTTKLARLSYAKLDTRPREI